MDILPKKKKELPLSVVIGALVHQNKVLLIRRVKGDYIGYWGFPGGKIEKNEHVSEAAVREIKEETGITSSFTEHLGLVSELLFNGENVKHHFLLHFCRLEPTEITYVIGEEGKLAWFDLNEIQFFKKNIIPSDYIMIEKMLLKREKSYYDCVIEKVDNVPVLKKFV